MIGLATPGKAKADVENYTATILLKSLVPVVLISCMAVKVSLNAKRTDSTSI